MKTVWSMVLFMLVLVVGLIKDSPELSPGEYRVTRVIDGDTIELETGTKVRYIGIDTPETKHPSKGVECYGREAAVKNAELVEGKVVTLVRDVSDTDRYGRLLRYVYVGDIFVNELLVSEGYAQVTTIPPDVAFQEAFRTAQETAQSEQRGLWGTECLDITSN